MDENQTTNNQNEKPSESEHIFTIILIGLIGIAGFIWVIVATDFREGVARFIPFANNQSEQYNEIMNADEVVGRDSEVLGLRIDQIIGRFFTHPETGATLYYLKEGVCEEECLNTWTPLVAEKALRGNSDLGTVKRSDDGTKQYVWKGNALYTYNDDANGSILGDGVDGIWRIARP